jgi:hypothetical protein
MGVDEPGNYQRVMAIDNPVTWLSESAGRPDGSDLLIDNPDVAGVNDFVRRIHRQYATADKDGREFD